MSDDSSALPNNVLFHIPAEPAYVDPHIIAAVRACLITLTARNPTRVKAVSVQLFYADAKTGSTRYHANQTSLDGVDPLLVKQWFHEAQGHDANLMAVDEMLNLYALDQAAKARKTAAETPTVLKGSPSKRGGH